MGAELGEIVGIGEAQACFDAGVVLPKCAAIVVDGVVDFAFGESLVSESEAFFCGLSVFAFGFGFLLFFFDVDR